MQETAQGPVRVCSAGLSGFAAPRIGYSGCMEACPGIGDVVGALGGSVGAVIASLPGPPATPAEFASALGLDRSLAWRLWRLAYAPTEAERAYHVPGAAAMRRFLLAGERAGASPGAVAAVRPAFERFERWVGEQAGDRETLRMMLDAGGDGERRFERLMFDAARYRLGVQVDAALRKYFVFPDEMENTVSAVNVILMERIRRLRPDARPVVAQRQAIFTGSPSAGTRIEHLRVALDPAGGEPSEEAAPVVAALTRNASIERSVAGGMIEDRLAPGAVGASGEGTLCTGELIRAYAPRLPFYDSLAFTALVTLPCRLTVFELAMHRELVAHGFEPVLRVRDRLMAGPGSGAVDLGCPLRLSGVRSVETADPPPGVRGYQALQDFVHERIDLATDSFVTFRVTAEHAPLGVAIGLAAESDAPGGTRGTLSEPAVAARARSRR